MYSRPVLRAFLRNAKTKHPRLPYHHQTLRPLQSRIGAVEIFIGAVGVSGLAWIAQKTLGSSLIPNLPIEAVVPTLDLEQATAKLSAEEHYERLTEGKGATFFTVRLASNSPVEDNLSHGLASGVANQKWMYWGVYDGHAGWATSSVLRNSLIPYVSQHLTPLPPGSTTESTVNAIKKAFTSLDDQIFASARAALSPKAQPPTPQTISALAPAIAGSCALFAAYNPHTSQLHTACTGDSRAVLGRLSPSATSKTAHTAEPLSIDQTGFNPAEVARLTAAHPNEPEILNPKTGRLLGFALTRAFGDSRGKWSNEEQHAALEHGWVPHRPIRLNATPPYFTAEPEVTTTVVREGDFMILASDGLWDHISSEDAVECVSRWLAAVKEGRIDPLGPAKALPKAKLEKPVFDHEEDDLRWITWRSTPEHFVVEDNNAATHLVKNTFGGSRRGLFCGVMSTYPPISRYVRDDVTVQVVFFGDAVKKTSE